jgi:hypothetical protein
MTANQNSRSLGSTPNKNLSDPDISVLSHSAGDLHPSRRVRADQFLSSSQVHFVYSVHTVHGAHPHNQRNPRFNRVNLSTFRNLLISRVCMGLHSNKYFFSGAAQPPRLRRLASRQPSLTHSSRRIIVRIRTLSRTIISGQLIRLSYRVSETTNVFPPNGTLKKNRIRTLTLPHCPTATAPSILNLRRCRGTVIST